MNTLLSKRLLYGVLATSFILINCQKAPSRPVNSLNDKNGKQTAVEKTTACDENMVKLLIDRKAITDQITAILADKSKIDVAQKEKLQQLANDLYLKSKDLFDAIRAQKIANAPAEACKQVDPKDAKNEKINKITEMQDADRGLAEKVRQETGRSNDLLDNLPVVLSAGKVLNIASDLATMLSDEKNLGGAKMLAEGKIEEGGENFEKLKADLAKSACVVMSTDKQAVAADSKAEIMNLSVPRVDEKSKRVVVDLALAIKTDGQGDRPMQLLCVIADKADPNAEILKSLGSLLSVVRDAAPTSNSAPQTEDSGEEAGTAEPTATDAQADEAARAGADAAAGTGAPTSSAPTTGDASAQPAPADAAAQSQQAQNQHAQLTAEQQVQAEEALRLMDQKLAE